MAIERVGARVNECFGKVYKNWDSVNTIFGEASVIASKQDKNGDTIQLLITENGKRRDLFKSNSKILDIIDIDGIKRTYCYEKDGELVKGQMAVAAPGPLVRFAKWITKDLVPQKVELTINPEHRHSTVGIVSRNSEDVQKTSILQNIVKVEAEDFKEIFSMFIPKKLTFTTKQGEVVKLDREPSENSHLAYRYNLVIGNPGNNLRVMV